MMNGRTVLFGLGAQKAGTSWLHRMLQRHHEVHLPLVKELHYWTAVRPPHFKFPAKIAQGEADFLDRAWFWQRARRYQTLSAFSATYTRDYTDRWNAVLASDGADHGPYCDLMQMGARNHHKVVGDITPAYALLDADTLREMATLGPDVKFIFLMRDPVARLWSGIKHRIRVSKVAATDRQAAANLALQDALASDPHMARRRSDYAETIRNLDRSVDPNNVLYLFYETLFSQQSFDRVTQFLDIAPHKALPNRKVNARSPNRLTPDSALISALIDEARAQLDDTYVLARERFEDLLPPQWV